MNATLNFDKENETRRERDERHVADPQPGDYWHEMFCGSCVVIHRMSNHVVICKTRQHFPEKDSWTWNLDKLEMMTLEEFREWLSYGSIPGFWASCVPGAHMWAVEHVNQAAPTKGEF